jgi:hypothetical protein
MANRAFDALPHETQQLIRRAAAQGVAHIDALGRAQDDALLGGLFARQGLRTTDVSIAMRHQFFEAAQEAREQLHGLVPAPLLLRVLQMLADYRQDHPHS